MKILIMGSGAVGGTIGGLLARSGEDVTFVARGAHLKAINANGLRVQSASAGEFIARAPAVAPADTGRRHLKIYTYGTPPSFSFSFSLSFDTPLLSTF